MTAKISPSLSCPPPLNGRAGGFTYVSIVKRLAMIMDKLIANNPQFSQQVKNDLIDLRDQVSDTKGKVPSRTIQFEQNTEEYKEWKSYEERFNVNHNTWLDLPWFFVENFYYRLILDIIGYFDIESVNYMVDPFQKQKEESLSGPMEAGSVRSTSESFQSFYEQYEREKDLGLLKDFIYLILVSDLWGNQADLSFSGGASHDRQIFEKMHREQQEKSEHIVINDTLQIVDVILEKFKKHEKNTYAFIVDNCGQEFLCDLFLAELLTHLGIAENIIFYVKSQPVFVSDVMEKDVIYTLKELSKQEDVTSQFGSKFMEYVNNGIWKIQADRFFCSPVPFWELPTRLSEQFSNCEIIFIKGDANYRRLINDALWPLDTSFCELLQYIPTSVVALRTLKSDALVGMLDGSTERKEKLKKLEKSDPEWRVNGKYGVIQFKK